MSRDRTVVLAIVVATLAMVVSALAEFALGVLGPFIVEDLGLSRTSFGALTSTFFLVASALSIHAGRRVDQVAISTSLNVLFGCGIVALVLLAVAPTYWLLIVAMVIAGLSAAGSNPIGNKVIAVHVTGRIQGLAMGIKQSGIQIATMTAGIVLPPLALRYGWRVAVLGLVPICVAGLVLTLARFRNDRDETVRGDEESDQPRAPMPPGLIRWLSGFSFLMGSGTSAVAAFVALFAFEAVDVPAHRAGTIPIALGVTGVIARITWGYLVGRIERPWMLLPGFAVVATLSTLLFAASPTVGEPLLWVSAVVFSLGAAAWTPVVYLSLVRLLGPEASGRGSGGVQGAFFLGMIISPLLFGSTADRAGYLVAWFVLTAVFTSATLLSTVWLLRIRRDDAVARRSAS